MTARVIRPVVPPRRAMTGSPSYSAIVSPSCAWSCDDGQSVVFGDRVPVVRLVGGLVDEPACGLPVGGRLPVDGHALPSAVHARGLVDAQGLGRERFVVGFLADRLAYFLDAWLELLVDVPAGVGLLLRP